MNLKNSKFVGFGLLILALALAGLMRADAGDGATGEYQNGIKVSRCEGEGGFSFSSGPPNQRTGAPDPAAIGGFEQTCRDGCHISFPLEANSDSLTLSVPTEYLPGQSYVLDVDLRYAGQIRWGFELTALDTNFLPVGVLNILEPTRTQKSTAGNGREYVKHTSAGTSPNVPNIAEGWTVGWTAPATLVGPVTFYAAGNAANFNGLNTGDRIHTKSATVPQAPDTDGDGLADAIETGLGTDPGLSDSDSDGVPDGVEVGDPNSPTDTDNDGLIDALDDDDDGDGVLTAVELPEGDTDSDGTPDYLDVDDDADGVLTSVELAEGDTDADGLQNYRDSDDDGDGILTIDEDVNGNGDPTDDDTDADQLANYLDDDDDGDGILTLNDECPLIPNPCPPMNCCDFPGDFNNDNSYNIGDVTAGIAFIFSGGAGPVCQQEGDFNGDGSYNIGDVTGGISFIFSGGAAPVCGP